MAQFEPDGDTSRRITILALFHSSWGEVDWILPVLYKLKERDPGIQIFSMFEDDFLYVEKRNNITTSRLLHEVSDDVFFPARFSGIPTFASQVTSRDYVNMKQRAVTSALMENLGGRKIDLILRDYAQDYAYQEFVFRFCPDAKIVAYPHGAAVEMLDPARAHEDNYPPFRHDVLMLTNPYCAELWRNRPWVGEIRQVGYPCLDEWWMKKLLQESGDGLLEGGVPKQEDFVILMPTRGIHPDNLEEPTRKNLLEPLVDFIKRRPDIFLIVKPHPRENTRELLRYFSNLPQERWGIWKGSLIEALDQCDLVASFYSGSVLFALAMQKPAIEYFQYPRLLAEFHRETDGTVLSTYRKLGVAIPADTIKQLEDLVDLYRTDPHNSIWLEQQRAFRKLRDETCDYSSLASDVILSMIDSRPKVLTELAESQ